MKTHKLNLLILLITLGLNCLAQQVPRQMVVLEIGTGTWCQYCPGAAMGAHELVENGHSVAVIEYHTYDDYQTDESDARIYDFYSMYAFPTAIFDGAITELSGSQTNSMYDVYLPHYEQRIEAMSDFSITMSFENTGGSEYTAHVTVDNVNAYAGSAVLQFVLTESHIPENWQNQEELDYVCRLMLPDENGTTLDFSGGNTLNFDFDFELETGWLAENCEVVAFIQDNETNEILQGNKLSLAWQPSSDATLLDLTVDGESLEGFDPETTYYAYWVPSGTQNPPAVDGIVNYAAATIEITQAPEIPGTASILVTAEDGTTQLEYEVEFFEELSSDATLTDLTVDGESLQNFDPETYYYAYWVPSGTQNPPAVDGIVNYAAATLEITQAPEIPGTASILVTAEDGTTQLEYEVEFFEGLSSDATLTDLTVDGESIEGFDPETTYYAYWVPSGTQNPPAVDGIVNYAAATIEITQAPEIPGTASILVTAEDGTTQLEYEVEFFEELSSDATLTDLTVDGESLQNFDPEIYFYEYWVPSGTQNPPAVEGIVNHPGATIEVTQAASIPGTASILVTAEDGITHLEYSVMFDSSIGLEELENQALLIYPNPASGQLTLQPGFPVDRAEIYNQVGQLCKRFQINGSKIILNVSDIEPGICFIKVFSHDQTITRKLVIE